MSNKDEYTEGNYRLALELKDKHKNYSEESDLIDRIQSFEMYKYACNWIKTYKSIKD